MKKFKNIQGVMVGQTVVFKVFFAKNWEQIFRKLNLKP